MIHVGTSGFSFDDWVGRVYPKGMKKSQMLVYYWSVLGFDSVEINFTYYSIPNYRTIVSLLRKTPPDFVFTVKVPGHVTHEGWKIGLDDDIVEKYLKALEPMVLEGRLKIHLAQFPYSFKFSQKNLEYVGKLSRMVEPLAVEFRHDSWNREEVYGFLKEKGITYVVVDEPKIEHLFPYVPRITGDFAYFRFHGRNDKWFEAEGSERYDYLYSDEDLSEFASDIKRLSERVEETFVFFNNCHEGKAVLNAKRMREFLNVMK